MDGAPGAKLTNHARCRAHPPRAMGQLESGGWGTFLGKVEAPGPIADARRKHFVEGSGVEKMWKPHAKTNYTMPSEPAERVGKRPLPGPLPPPYVRSQRGHIPMPEAWATAGEMPMCESKKKHPDALRRGVELTMEKAISRHGRVENRRNWIPAARPGDKSYVDVERSDNFHSIQSNHYKHRQWLEQQRAVNKLVSLHLEKPQREPYGAKQARLSRTAEVASVTDLPKYPKRPTTPAATETPAAPVSAPPKKKKG
eukprot:NODE_3106_length_940_cov_38.769988_g3085_i0.p1 GENE.NODE_3106_length_940_cov_38.769988_g3085_i0~~NODE_3106_length_940_cov_38.769988_g3085_i0.p1  ORF type:complete len:255 (-),score=25.66 NODE_3106_length_940_cov_38.769988_g3085_i0:98-862(-)